MHQLSPGAKDNYLLLVASPKITESAVRGMVEPFGTVAKVDVVNAYSMGFSCGFACVEMVDDGAAARAVAELNGKSINGHCLRVRLGFWPR